MQAGEVIQAMAAEAGFDVRVVAAEFGTVLAATMRGEFQVTLGGWSGLLDPDSKRGWDRRETRFGIQGAIARVERLSWWGDV